PPHRTYTLSLHDALPICETEVTLGAIRSAKVEAPASLQRKRIVVTERKVRGPSPVSSPTADRRSRDTSYPSTDSRAARSRASSRSEEHTSELQSLRHLVC